MEFKQDMPPPGGYAPITYKRVPLKSGTSPIVKLLISCGITGVGWVGLHYARDRVDNEKTELKCGRLALYPMLQAEVDRMMLKQLRKNRDAEEEIMKNVKGWEVGKWKGHPVFNTLGPDEFFKPKIYEYYAHADEGEAMTLVNLPKFV